MRSLRALSVRPAALLVALMGVGLGAPSSRGAEPQPVPVTAVQSTAQRIVWKPPARRVEGQAVVRARPGVRGPGCTPVVDSVANCYNSIDQGGEITLQLGMVEGEGFASTYSVADPNPATPENEAFPVEVQLVEFVAGTPATGIGSNIAMGYTIEVWDGEPGQAGSSLAFTVTSGDPQANPELPPDISLARVQGASTACTTNNDLLVRQALGQPIPASVAKVQFSVDQTADPGDRMIVNGLSGTGKVSVVVKIARHNQPGATACSTVSFCNNAFLATEGTTITPCAQSSNPATPTYPTRNWLEAISCAGGCPAGYTRFSALSSSCRPSRDVLQQITYVTSVCAQPATGACCAASGACTAVTRASCTATYQGDGTVCSPNPCPQPSGACCAVNGSCSVGTSAACGSAGGTFRGAGTTCATVTCPQPTGACCTSSGGCAVIQQGQCTSLGGTFIGANVACGTNGQGQAVCPLGACCRADGSCTGNLSQPACASAGGTFQGVGSACGGVSCPQPTGACCTSGGSCAEVQASVCSLFGGTWRGGLTVCAPNPCAAGVCCRGSTCAAGVSPGSCTGSGTAGAVFTAAGAACNAGSNATSPCCYADFNKRGNVELLDIFDFLTGWFNGNPYCRFGGDGTGSPDLLDIFSFLTAWFQGPCP